jgi:hypothetical protein
MEYYDGNKLTEEIKLVMRDVNWSIFYIFSLFSMFSVCAFFWPYCWNDYIFYVCFLCCCNSTASFTNVRCCTIKSSTPQPGWSPCNAGQVQNWGTPSWSRRWQQPVCELLGPVG